MESVSLFASRLVAIMTEQRLTTEALAEELGWAVSPRTLWRWRSGQSAPGIEILPALVRALDTTANYLLGIDEEDA